MRQFAHVLRALLTPPFIVLCLLTVVAPLSARIASLTHPSAQPLSQSEVAHSPDLTQAHSAQSKVVYGDGPVMAGTTSVYAIFWEPTSNVSSRYDYLIERYFNDVGESSLYRLARQYKQANGGFPSNAVLAGVWKDTQAYRTNPLLDTDIQHEVKRAQRVNGWHSSLNNLFFVFTERNADVCMDSTRSECAGNGYCAYHNNLGTKMIYATVPYSASFSCDFTDGPNHDDADQTIDSISHEQMESVTDPLGTGWVDTDGNEIGDKCVDNFGPLNAQGANVVWNGHPYRVQKEWDNRSGSCRLKPLA